MQRSLSAALLCAVLLCLLPNPGRAQTGVRVPTCNLTGVAPPQVSPFYVDANGNLCTSGGAAGTVTAPGTPGATAQAVQGVPGGVAVPVTQAGSNGTDFSANAATIPMAGYVLLTTIPVTATRAAVEVQNQSAAVLQVVRDDGAGANQTSILIGSAGAVGTAGSVWSSTTFKGRVRVYGPAGSQVAADQE